MLRDRLRVGITFALLGLLPFVLPGRSGAILLVLYSTLLIPLVLLEFFMIIKQLGLESFARFSAGFAGLWMAWSGGVLIFSDGQSALPDSLWPVLPALFLMALLGLALRESDQRAAVVKIFSSLAGVIFILATLGWMTRIYFWRVAELESSGRILLLYMLMVTKMSDVGGYAVGTMTARRSRGNHKMIPRLSPGKSWEGLVGGLAAGVVSALAFTWPRQVLFGAAESPGEWGRAALFGLSCALVGLVGDVFASLLKRAAQVKDSGNLPGLGGTIDILDSLFFVTPLFYAYLHFFTS